MPERIAELTRRQDGLVTRGQAIAAGMTTTLINGQLRIGRWARILPEVYSSGGTTPEPMTFIRAAFLWAGPGAVIESAAALIWQRRSDRALSEVAVPAGATAGHPRRRGGRCCASPGGL